MNSPLIEHDLAIAEQYRSQLIGIDEVGRGCLLGPVYAAAVCIPDLSATVFSQVRDSKQLSEAKRISIAQQLATLCRYSIQSSSVQEINQLGIVGATMLAMRRAACELLRQTEHEYLVLVDGRNTIPGLDVAQRSLVKGDQKSAHIATASILAKCARDTYVSDVLSRSYPGYDLPQNKGYGTKTHINAIRQIGLCPEHRVLFVRRLIAAVTQSEANT